jgi:hypothetical protein
MDFIVKTLSFLFYEPGGIAAIIILAQFTPLKSGALFYF